MFITEAFAQTAQAPGSGSYFIQFVPLLLIVAIMYVLLIRPQQKKLKDHRDMVASIRRGDTVVTSGGFIGKVTKVIGDAELIVEIADGVRVRVVRGTISEVRARGDVREAEARRKARADNDDDPDEDGDAHPDKKLANASRAQASADKDV
jgi:preprotein translocase subunit YajC